MAKLANATVYCEVTEPSGAMLPSIEPYSTFYQPLPLILLQLVQWIISALLNYTHSKMLMRDIVLKNAQASRPIRPASCS